MKNTSSTLSFDFPRYWKRRGWEVFAIDGPDCGGRTLHAWFLQRQQRYGWWQFRVEYGEIDSVPVRDQFNVLLKKTGDSDFWRQTWLKHVDSLPRHARLSGNNWRWCSGSGLSKALVDELREGVISCYAKARKISLGDLHFGEFHLSGLLKNN
jgi:hypothetical protein